MRLATSEDLTQVDIEAAIQATRWTRGTHAAPLAGEGSGSTLADTTDGMQLGGVESCPDVLLLSDTEERRKHAQIKDFNCLNPPEFKNKTTTIEAEEWLRQSGRLRTSLEFLRTETESN